MEQPTLPVAVAVPDDVRTVLNNKVWFQDADGIRLVLVCGSLFFQYALGDRDSEAFLIAILARDGHARVKDIAQAFGIDPKTVYRHRKRLEKEGLRGMIAGKRGPKGAWKIDAALRRRILAAMRESPSIRAVARRLGLSPRSVTRVLAEEGFEPEGTPTLPGLEIEEPPVSDESVPPSTSVPDTPEVAPASESDRSESREALEDVEEAPRAVAEAVPVRAVERGMAARGALVEAAPVLESGTNLRGAGLFLALPCLLEVGILDVARQVYRSLKPGFYGLRSFLLTLLFMALFRIKRPEGLKGLPPEILGRLLGLDRSPEVKTVRRKLNEIAARGKSHEFVGALGRRIREEHEDLLGFLYVDGHVRAYSGRRTLPKTWVPTRRLCLPATTDYWVNDAEGDPFFFVTTEGNPALSKVLPGLLEEVQDILSGQRATVIFDRGGWSQKTLARIGNLGFDYITYRRRPYDPLPSSLFQEYDIEGKTIDLAESTVEFKALGTLRLVAKRDPDGDQVHILTNLDKEMLSTEEVYLRMVRRWRQENYFKYMKEELALDALVSYEMVPADEDRLVPNPQWKQQDRLVREQRATVKRLERQMGACAVAPEGNDITSEDIEGALHETARQLSEAEEELARRLEQRRAIPKHVPLRKAVAEPPKRLEFERKIFTDAIKMSAYRVETALVNAVASHYHRAGHEARKLIQEAFHASGDIEVDDFHVTVRLEPLSSPHRTRAMATLCEKMSAMDATYPGTKLRLRYTLRQPPDRAS